MEGCAQITLCTIDRASIIRVAPMSVGSSRVEPTWYPGFRHSVTAPLLCSISISWKMAKMQSESQAGSGSYLVLPSERF